MKDYLIIPANRLAGIVKTTLLVDNIGTFMNGFIPDGYKIPTFKDAYGSYDEYLLGKLNNNEPLEPAGFDVKKLFGGFASSALFFLHNTDFKKTIVTAFHILDKSGRVHHYDLRFISFSRKKKTDRWSREEVKNIRKEEVQKLYEFIEQQNTFVGKSVNKSYYKVLSSNTPTTLQDLDWAINLLLENKDVDFKSLGEEETNKILELLHKIQEGKNVVLEKGLWKQLNKVAPEKLLNFSISKIVESQNDALKEFKTHLDSEDWKETEWQKFFEKNTWIFGYGLSLRWVQKIGEKLEAVTTGNSITKPGKKPDSFLKTLAEVSNTVFVDIKTPQALLLKAKEYRPGVFQVGKDVSGGVSQIQVSISDWIEAEGYKTDFEDKNGYASMTVFSHKPKGVLVVGNLKQFKKEENYHPRKVSSFENYRAETHNPEIITFDELFRRAENILEPYKQNDEQNTQVVFFQTKPRFRVAQNDNI